MMDRRFLLPALALLVYPLQVRAQYAPKPEAQAAYEEGKRDSGEAAIAAFTRAVEADPGFFAAWLARAAARRVTGEADLALDDCHHALLLRDSDPDALLVRGFIAYYYLNDRAMGVADLDRARQIDPLGNQGLPYNFGGALLALEARHYDLALQYASNAIKLDKTHEPAWIVRALAGLGLRAVKEAERREAEKAASKNPRRPPHPGMGDPPEEEKPEEDKGLKELAALVDQADSDAQEALKLAKEDPLAEGVAAAVLAARDKDDEAIAAYKAVTDRVPSFAWAHNRRGDLLRRNDKDDEAIAAYDAALAVNPLYADAWTNRGKVHAGKKDYEKALDDYAAAILIDPENPEVYVVRGDVFYKIKKYERAMLDWERFATLSPKDSRVKKMAERLNTARRMVARMELKLESVAEFIERADKFLEERSLQEAEDDYRHAIGLILKEPEEKRKQYTDLLQTAWYNLACACSLGEKIDDALDALGKSIDAGYENFDWMKQDSDLENVRKDPRFQELLKREKPKESK
ncbi:MAG: tetratricopeptide repeat protein [Planctomycetes bacterium]|nr:tetratricopeptide repeat protein [Planctomycetota bacterium]